MTATKTPTRTRKPATGNPATTVSPVTGKRQGPPRKPLTTVVGSMGTRTTSPTRPTRKPAAKPAAKPVSRQASKPAAKAAPASRQLPRDLVRTVTAAYAGASKQDQQRVANYLKVVTTGTAACGCRWWPAGKGTLPRPTHMSWAPCGKPAHAASNKP